jgi:uncharacterized membrane protein (UPF0127 family)
MRLLPLTITTIVAASLLLTACGTKELTLSSEDGSVTKTIQIEIADNLKERNKGLMNRTELAPDTGMLFVFPKGDILQFWMKNTKIPLDIIYFDADGRFVNVLTMEPCTKDPCPEYKSAALAQFALEVPKGFREANEIGVGWKLDLKEVKRMSRPT